MRAAQSIKERVFMYPRCTFLVAVLLLLACCIGRSEDAPKDEPKEYEGMVMSAGDEKLVIKIGEEEFTFDVTEDTSIRFEGEDSELQDIKEGHFAKVTATSRDDKLSAKAIDARMAQ
jgi:hypothetical protein